MAAITEQGQQGQAQARVAWVDLARSAALAGMVVYHFTFDLALFGHIPPELPVTGPFAILARLVAGSFLFLAGLSLWLAHGRAVRWRAFARRLAILAGAAGLVTLATWLAVPQAFIHFGILHSIAVCSVLGLAVLRLPPWLIAAVALAVLATPHLIRIEAFATPWLYWTGLAPQTPPTLDFEPVFPWFAPFLAGVAVGKWAGFAGWLGARPGPHGPALRALAWPGRHSLVIYLVHQPVLIALIWAGTRLAG